MVDRSDDSNISYPDAQAARRNILPEIGAEHPAAGAMRRQGIRGDKIGAATAALLLARKGRLAMLGKLASMPAASGPAADAVLGDAIAEANAALAPMDLALRRTGKTRTVAAIRSGVYALTISPGGPCCQRPNEVKTLPVSADPGPTLPQPE